MDIAAYFQNKFQFTLNLAALAVANPSTLGSAVFMMEIGNVTPGGVWAPVYSWSSSSPPALFPNGSLAYAAGTTSLTAIAPSGDIQRIFATAPATYNWYAGFYFAADPSNFIRIDGGTLTFARKTGETIGIPSFANDTVVVVSSSGQSSATPSFTGDSGLGGVAGLVPAPGAGSAAAGLVLGAGGAFAVPYQKPINVLSGSGLPWFADETSFSAAYDDYEIVCENLIPATTNAQLVAQVYSSGAFATTNYLSSGTVLANGTGSGIVSITPAVALSYPNIDSTANGVSGSIKIYNVNQSASWKNIISDLMHQGTGSSPPSRVIAGGYWKGGVTPITGILIGMMVSGSFVNVSGKIKIFGR